MADDIPEVALYVWVEVRVLLFERFGLAHVDQVPSRLLQRDIAYLDLHSGCLSEERFMCAAIDKSIWEQELGRCSGRVHRLASRGAFDTNSSACRTDKPSGRDGRVCAR